MQGKHLNLTKCPVCNEDRYSSRSLNSPRKRFKYIPLESRLRKWFGHDISSSLLQSHQYEQQTEKKVSSIHQSKAWKEWYGKDGQFAGQPRTITFAVCLDGTNPFAHDKTNYSMCPITLVSLNTPETVRKRSASTVLVGIIPGPSEPRNTDPYVDVLVDEVNHLNTLTLYDANKKEYFPLKVNTSLHNIIFDYPGQNKNFNCQGRCYFNVH